MLETRALRFGRAVLALLVLVALAAWPAHAEQAPAAADEAVPPHNYILLIDNSRSTTGRHSLGDATDPRGLRFDAARLVYQNVVTSAATGATGKLGVIVFCGTKNCVSYGPLDIGDPALDDQIGSKLNEAANAGRRDDYTDICAALEAAKAMLDGFEGETGVLLLTDGVNDLTNRSDPFSRPENIEANDRSVQLVGDMRAAGADVYIVALTDSGDVDTTAPFMAFISRLAEAGGGERTAAGEYGNVLMATQADLGSKLLQLLIKAESASDAIQTIVEYTPVDAPFTVPYDGITDATVNITFMPEEKDLLERVDLVAPDGAVHTLWDGEGVHEAAGITVTEDRSYIMLAIPSPQAGDWNVVVASRKTGGQDARVLLNAVVRFNHSLRLNVAMDAEIDADVPARLEAWFQKYDGEAFEDLTGSDIYAQSEARLTVTTPGGKKKTVVMKRDGDRYVTAFRARTPGTWKALVRVKNPWVQETADEIAFEVAATPEPTPEPVATPTPTPEVAPIENLTLSIEPSVTAENGDLILAPGDVTFSWQVEGETESVEAEVLEGDKSLGSVVSGITFPGSFFRPDVEYAFRVSALPVNGSQAGVEPTVQTLAFRAAPQPIPAEAVALSVTPVVPDSDDTVYVDRDAEQITLAWTIDEPTESVEAKLLKDGQPLAAGLQSGDAVDRALLEDGATYTLSVAALPVNGALAGVELTVQTLDFQLYPLSQPIVGLTLETSGGQSKNGVARLRGRSVDLTWRLDSGSVDHYQLTVADAKGNAVLSQTLDAGADSYSLTLPRNGDYRAELAAAARYAPEAQEAATAALKLHTLTLLEKYWYLLAAALLLLAGSGAALLMLLKDRNARHVTGSLRVRCDALEVNQLLTLLEDRKGVKLDDPVVKHPALSKLKGKKAFELLSNVRLNNAMTNRDGLAPGEDGDGAPLHRPNVRVVRLTYTNPRTGETAVRYVGRYDVAPVTLTLEDGATDYEFTFSGS